MMVNAEQYEQSRALAMKIIELLLVERWCLMVIIALLVLLIFVVWVRKEQ